MEQKSYLWQMTIPSLPITSIMGKIANNQPCTGIIYAEIVSRHLKTESKDVLVVGLGEEGFPGAAHFVHKGFKVYGYDADTALLEKTASNLGITPFDPSNTRKFSMIFRGDSMCKYDS